MLINDVWVHEVAQDMSVSACLTKVTAVGSPPGLNRKGLRAVMDVMLVYCTRQDYMKIELTVNVILYISHGGKGGAE